MTATPIRLLCLFLGLFHGVNAFAAYEEMGVEDNNEFGGRTVLFRKVEEGISRGRNSYDSAGKIMREERTFSDDWANIHGTKSVTNEYLFDIKIKEERTFSATYATTRLIAKTTTFFEQATGTKVRVRNDFAEEYLGYNITYYDLGVKQRMEWFYPKNELGYVQVNTFYDPSGKLIRTENLYTEKSIRFDGCSKSVFYSEGEKRLKREWFFTETYAKANNGAVRKVTVYFDNPNFPIAPKTYYFNDQDETVTPAQPFEED